MANLLLVNPRFDGLVRRHGLDDFNRVLRLAGRLTNSHADRDVCELRLDDCGKSVRLFLKRDRKTTFRSRFINWLAGFGRATRSRREWFVLMAMIDAGIGCAETVVCAERGTLRPSGYLILCEIERAVPLSEYMIDHRARISVRDRRQLAAHIGHEVARLHEAGITHPDLYSKHVYLSEAQRDADRAECAGSGRSALRPVNLPRVAFLDLERGGIRRSVSFDRRTIDLAALDATLRTDLVSATDRLTFLQSYLSHVRCSIDIRSLVAAVRKRGQKIARREKIREMRETEPADALP